MLKKIRIQLFDNDQKLISDRLVDQDTEFYAGPKEKHDGPVKLEVMLLESSDADKIITYLKQLALDLPIKAKTTGKRGRPKKVAEAKDELENNREEFIQRTFDESVNQDDFIKRLRAVDFEFIDSDRLQLIIPESYNIKSRHLKRYQWLLKLTRRAKDPRNDKYDITTLIGISILEKRDPKMVVYLFGDFHKTYKADIPKVNYITTKQTNLIKYPHYMTYEERLKWGVEHRALINQKEKKPSKFYRRWYKDVKVGEELKLDPKRLELG